MKFTGTFKNLKNHGYTFQKLYAANYKCYRKKINEYDSTLWIFVGNGGSIEFEDWYGNTERLIELIKTINWDYIETNSLDYKYTHLRWYRDSKKGTPYVSKNSADFDLFISIYQQYPNYNKLSKEEQKDIINKCKPEVYCDFEREEVITEELSKKLLSEIETIQNC
jgi:hypothetical protein